MQLMHKTPSLWTRAGVPWIFGHDPNKYRTTGGATTTGRDATYPPAICQNSGGGGSWRGGVQPGVGGWSSQGSGGGVFLTGVGGGSDRGSGRRPARGEGGGVRVRVTELVEPVLVL